MSRQGRALDVLRNYKDPERAGEGSGDVALDDPLDVLNAIEQIDPYFHDKQEARLASLTAAAQAVVEEWDTWINKDEGTGIEELASTLQALASELTKGEQP